MTCSENIIDSPGIRICIRSYFKAFGLRREALAVETHPIPSDRLVQGRGVFYSHCESILTTTCHWEMATRSWKLPWSCTWAGTEIWAHPLATHLLSHCRQTMVTAGKESIPLNADYKGERMRGELCSSPREALSVHRQGQTTSTKTKGWTWDLEIVVKNLSV